MDPDSDRWVRTDDARRHLRVLLNEVEHDDTHIFVLRYDKPAAVIVPVRWYEQAKQALGGTTHE